MKLTEISLGKKYLAEINGNPLEIIFLHQSDNHVKLKVDGIEKWFTLSINEIEGTQSWEIIKELPHKGNSGKQMLYG